LAAARAGIRNVILPKPNEKDLVEIPAKLKRRLNFIFVTEVGKVFTEALAREPVAVKEE